MGIWWLTLSALAIAVYAPLPYLTAGIDGLAAGGHEIAANYAARPAWVHVALYVHIAGAATALLLAPVQLAPWVRARVPRLHRVSGRIVIAGMLVGGVGGLALAPVNYAGPVGTLGFGTLAVLSLAFPVLGLLAIRRGDVVVHRRWMLRSFARDLRGRDAAALAARAGHAARRLRPRLLPRAVPRLGARTCWSWSGCSPGRIRVIAATPPYPVIRQRLRLPSDDQGTPATPRRRCQPVFVPNLARHHGDHALDEETTMADLQGTCDPRFDGLRAALQANVDSGEELGASFVDRRRRRDPSSTSGAATATSTTPRPGTSTRSPTSGPRPRRSPRWPR